MMLILTCTAILFFCRGASKRNVTLCILACQWSPTRNCASCCPYKKLAEGDRGIIRKRSQQVLSDSCVNSSAHLIGRYFLMSTRILLINCQKWTCIRVLWQDSRRQNGRAAAECMDVTHSIETQLVSSVLTPLISMASSIFTSTKEAPFGKVCDIVCFSSLFWGSNRNKSSTHGTGDVYEWDTPTWNSSASHYDWL
jgi:hypothetical protein